MIITAGIYKGRKIEAPNEKITRPTLSKTRMGVFNTLYSLLGDFSNKSFLDVFGGSGIMGIEAISRGFESVTVFEKNKFAANTIKNNYKLLNLVPNIYIGDSEILIKKINNKYNVAYVDPPFESNLYTIIENIKADIIAVEHSKKLDLGNFNIIKEKVYGSVTVTYIEGNL